MEIKVNKPQLFQQKDQAQKDLRMTLREYLQSTNLKRKITSRSKSKHKNHSDCKAESQNYLETPFSFQTIEYFKLNQQWKAKKTFNSWIAALKQLVRQHISKDSDYLEVVRLIQKIVEFVRIEIQAIKKDNLLLESFLVTQASYWPAEGSTYNQEANHDKISNYLKAIVNKGSPSQSPNKSQQFIETHSPQLRHQIQRKAYKTSTQPKIRVNNHQVSTNHASKNQKNQNSSTDVKKFNSQPYSASQTLENNVTSNGEQQQYIYSFKDKNHDPKFLYSKNSMLGGQKHVNVRPFQSFQDDPIDESNENLQHSKFHEPDLLKIHSKNQDEVPRLSLMSRYDQNKSHPSSLQNLNGISLSKIIDNQTSIAAPSNPSQISTKSHISHSGQYQKVKQIQSKVPLRERKQKTQKINNKEAGDEFSMIVLDKEMKIYEPNCYQEQIIDTFISKKSEKNEEKEQQNYESTPLALRQSPHIVALGTPSTLKRKNLIGSEIVDDKKEQKIRINTSNLQNSSYQLNERSFRSNSAVYKSYELTKSNSREKILKRYENFVRK